MLRPFLNGLEKNMKNCWSIHLAFSNTELVVPNLQNLEQA